MKHFTFLKKAIALLLLLTSITGTYAQVSRKDTRKSVAYRANYQRMSAGGNHTLELRGGALWAWGDNVYGQTGNGNNANLSFPYSIGLFNVVTVSGGLYHSAAIKDNGNLYTWGRNNYGQLGLGNTTDINYNQQVGSLQTWTSVSCGSFHTIALRADGTLWAWGRNATGQLGIGNTTQQTAPVQIGVGTSWIAIAAGDSSSYAIRNDGTLWAWGFNGTGQLGLGNTTQQIAPVQVGVAANWVSVASSGGHTLAINSNGTLWAWGKNTVGQLGNGNTTQQNSPVQIGTLTTWVRVATGVNHTLALKVDGTLWAWGLNSNAQLGNSTTTNTSTPTQVGTATNWVSISAGAIHSLAARADGTMAAFGGNNSGQLGTGASQFTAPTQVGAANNWMKVVAAGTHSLAIKTDSTLWAWGNNNYGQLGNNTTNTSNTPVQIGTATNWKHIYALNNSCVAIKSNGTLWAWGNNDRGQLGIGNTTQQLVPVQIGTATDWATAVVADRVGLAIKTNGTLWAWGTNDYAQFGNGSIGNTQYTPIQIGTATDWAKIDVGVFHVMATKTNNTLWTWGLNNLSGIYTGMLGDGSITDSTIPIQIGSNALTSLDAGAVHNLIVRSNGTMWAWGFNANGQCGDGGTTNLLAPTQIGSLTTWAAVSGGNFHSIALRNNGTLWAWGNNSSGQLGLGNTTASGVPLQVGVATNWAKISAGVAHTLAIKTDGTLWAWGSNSESQLGFVPVDQPTPITVSVQLSNWLSITAGEDFTLALREDGTLWGWGNNYNGQLGLGSSPSSTSAPYQIGTDNTWISVDAGGTHALALKANGTLWAWGYNGAGQLGDNTYTNRNTPVQIGTDNTWASVSAGGSHSMALKSDGTLWTWGYNYNGQLGLGTTTSNYLLPTQVGALTTWTSISAGGFHSMAIRVDGNLWSAGMNDYGQIGDNASGSANNRLSFVQTSTANVWHSASAGYYHSIALRADGSIYNWGYNYYSQLGDGNTSLRATPFRIGTANNWIAVAAGFGHTFALQSTAFLSAWGWNLYGQLAISSNTNSTTPFVCDYGKVAVACGGYHTASLPTQRNYYCTTGQNSNGQLGYCDYNDQNDFVCVDFPPTVLTAPVNTAGCINGTATFSISASNTSTYQWQESISGVYSNISNNGIFSGVTTSVLTISNLSAPYSNRRYRCIISNSNGCPNTVTSSFGILTVYSLPSVTASASPGTLVCSGTNITLSGNGAVSYTWDNGVTNGTPFQLNNTTSFYVTGTNANGCSATFGPYVITVNPLPNVNAVANPSLVLCAGQSVNLSGTGASSYVWNGGIADGVAFTPTITSTYTVTGTDGNGCQNTAIKTITVNPLPTLTITATPSATICNGQSVTLSASGAATYGWSGGITNGTAFSPTVTTTYTVTGTSASNCVNTATRVVTVNPIPNVNATANPSFTICRGQSVTLSGSGASSYSWTGGISNGTAFSPTVTTTYSVTGTSAAGCQKTVAKTVVVNLTPTVTVTSASICNGQSATLTANGANSFSWSAGATSTGTNIATAAPNTTTNYTVIGTTTNCSSSAVANVVVTPLPNVTVNSPAICSGNLTTLTANGAASYAWSTGATTTGSNTASVAPNSATNYTVTGTALGCSNTAIASVTILTAPVPDICVVTVDNNSVNNIIYWDKTNFTNVASFRIYRDTANNNYAPIGLVPFDSLSQFIDTVRYLYTANGDPNLTSWRYKLSTIDTCGSESALSPYHQTIFLQNNNGNFSWSQYQIEGQPIPVPGLSQFSCDRDPLSNGVWNPIATVSASSTAFTDVDYLLYPNGSWRTKTIWNITCEPTRTQINTTRSNIKNPPTITSSVNGGKLDGISIYPNPTNDYFYVASTGSAIQLLVVYNALGEMVYKNTNFGQQQKIAVSEWKQGVYFVEITNERGRVVRKLVKE